MTCRHRSVIHLAESPLWECDACGSRLTIDEWRRYRETVAAARSVVDAVCVAGSHPTYHYAARRALSRDWPTLWKAITRLVEATS